MSSLASQAEKAKLTPPIAIHTPLPFPIWKTTTDASNPDSAKIRTISTQETVIANVCSEFTNYEAPVAPISAQHKLAIIQDTFGQPVVFSIGDDNRLYCARHIQGGSDGWVINDITPGQTTSVVSTFDVSQDITTQPSALVNLTVAISTSVGGVSDVYTILGLDISLSTFNWATFPWVQRVNNLGPRPVTALSVSSVAQIRDGVYPFALVGTSGGSTSPYVASDYLVSMNKSDKEPWSHNPLPSVATKVIKVSPGHLLNPIGFGTFTLFQSSGYSSGEAGKREGPDAADVLEFNSFPKRDSTGKIIEKGMLVMVLLQEIGGIAKDIAPLNNNRGDTDLLVAGSAGIGFYPSFKLSEPLPSDLVIMKDENFHPRG